jgi:hypothetical protein
MGREVRRLTISGTVSRHNSDEDTRDDADWEDLQHRVSMIARERRYENLEIVIGYEY